VGVTAGTAPQFAGGQAAGVGVAGQVGTFVLNADPGSLNLNPKQSSFDTLMARVALLEAT
jgi:hypothetical protein